MFLQTVTRSNLRSVFSPNAVIVQVEVRQKQRVCRPLTNSSVERLPQLRQTS